VIKMFGPKTYRSRRNKDQAEKPFWISFSDMMTALMVLFLVSMAVTLLAVTHNISEEERKKAEREEEIKKLLMKMKEETKKFPGISLRGPIIDFGDQARFATNSHLLTEEQERYLRTVMPSILAFAKDPLGKKWIKRIVVEGYADQRGTYLHNLNLSLQRSERVLCVLLSVPENGNTPLSKEDRLLIRELFLVGGSSFNSLKNTLEESRRIELKLEFLEIDETRPKAPSIPLDEEQCCPLDKI